MNKPSPKVNDIESSSHHLGFVVATGVLAWLAGLLLVSQILIVDPAVDLEGFGNLVLMDRMSWTATEYTTIGSIAEKLPFAAYRAPVFPQPPGFAWYLKLGAAISLDDASDLTERSIAAKRWAMALYAIAFAFCVYSLIAWCQQEAIAFDHTAWGVAAIAVCPIINASVVWLRSDGVAAIMAGSALLGYSIAVRRNCWKHLLLSTSQAAVAIALNAQSLWAIPFVIVLWTHSRFTAREESAKPPRNYDWWLVVFVFGALSLSAAHYIRLLWNYSPTVLCGLFEIDPSLAESDPKTDLFMRIVYDRPAVKLIWEWLAFAPAVLVVPWSIATWRSNNHPASDRRLGGEGWFIATVIVVACDFSLRWLWGGPYQLRFCGLWSVILLPAWLVAVARLRGGPLMLARNLGMMTICFQMAACVTSATALAEPAYVTPPVAYMFRPWLDAYPNISTMK